MNYQPLTSKELTKIGQSLFGSRWKTPLAQAIGVERETVSRWASGSPISKIGPAGANEQKVTVST